MKPFNYRRSVLAVAVAACSTAAYAQTPCDQEIRQLEQEIQQGQMDQQQQSAIEDLLRAAQDNPNDCNVYVSRAEEVMSRAGGAAETPQSQTAQQPSGQQETPQRDLESSADPQVRPATTAEPSSQTTARTPEQDPSLEQERMAQESERPQAGESERTMDIQVDQPPAEVDVQTRSPSIVVKQQPAEITVEQKPPEVEITQREPEISVQQPEPEVTINQAEPDVQVSQSEPEVEVQQSEPEVHVQQPEATAQVQTDQPQSDEQSQEARPFAGSGSQSAGQVNLEDVQGSQALSSTGEEVGEVQEFVRSRTDGTAYALVDAGGVLGIGARTVAIPLEQASLTEDGQLQTPYSQDQIEQLEEYDEQLYEEVPQSEFAALEAELESSSTQQSQQMQQ